MFCSHFQITILKHPSGNVHVPKFHLPVTAVTLYYLEDIVVSVDLDMDLHITQDRWVSTSKPLL